MIKPIEKSIKAADLFCGAGGTTTGMINAFMGAGIKYNMIGINHCKLAIKAMKLNHPEVKPFRATLESVDPCDVAPDGYLDFLWASPECTNHSNAKTGKPKSNQSRCQPEMILSWIRKLIVKRVYIENVIEFLNWGPLLAKDTVIKGKKYYKGFPDPRKKGVFFKDWINSIKKSGYNVDWQILNAADFGAPTSRRRLIIQAVRIGTRSKIIWPYPTHSKAPSFFEQKRWIPAKEIIDWKIPGKSIFNRKTPLAENTLRKIESGIKKYWGEWAEPFLVILRGESICRNINSPVPTISCSGAHLGLVSPTLVKSNRMHNYFNKTTLAKAPEAFITRFNGGDNRHHSIQSPIPVIDTSNRYALVEPVIKEINPPERVSLKPFLIKFNGSETGGHSIEDPIGTITTKERFGIVNGDLYSLDILFRMLKEHELAAATGFPESYCFTGKHKDKVRQIGNAVPPSLAEALISAALAA